MILPPPGFKQPIKSESEWVGWVDEYDEYCMDVLPAEPRSVVEYFPGGWITHWRKIR